MPHPIPIIIGTTIAVIGTGYAFKKFVYDPHLAPYVEAFIAYHSNTRARVKKEESEPIAVSVAPFARTTAREDINYLSPRRRTAQSVASDPALYELDNARIDSRHHDSKAPVTLPCDRPLPPTPFNPVTPPLPPIPFDAPFKAVVEPLLPLPPPKTSRSVSPPLIIFDAVEPTHAPISTTSSSLIPSTSSASGSKNMDPPVARLASSATLVEYPVVILESPVEVSPMTHEPILPRNSSIDDLDIISISAATSSYVDAESYSPRSDLSPLSPLSRATSPVPEFFQLQRPQSPSSSPRSLRSTISSWGDDERWHSEESEWEAISETDQ